MSTLLDRAVEIAKTYFLSPKNAVDKESGTKTAIAAGGQIAASLESNVAAYLLSGDTYEIVIKCTAYGLAVILCGLWKGKDNA